MARFAKSSGFWIWLLASSIASTVAGQESPISSSKPLTPAEALTKFVLAEPDLKIELAAAEPEVVDPVDIRFDEKGRMWVVEMRDYPLGPPPGEAPLSRIKVLEDRDADGRFETATVFADKLSFVTGLQPWRGGVIVTLAGRIAWMKDTNEDGRMDVDETWYTGFAELNSQLRANHPRLALDNHVYVANGLKGGMVVNKRLPDEKPISLQGRDFRFDPITGKAESISGNGQFGLCFDDWGNRFTCTNRNPVIHVVLEDRYLKLAPKIPVASVVQDVAAAAEQSKVYPISRAWTTSNLHAGTFTAACGVHVYRGDTLRSVLGTNSVFTCDPTGNFVHREIMQPDGPSFKSKPAYDGKEFLASTDEWFRPVSVELGPDGCMYVVDMYRCVIEHPDFVPDELKKRPDMRLGDDKGRIWRIVPSKGIDNERRKLAIELPTELGEAVRKLNHANAWQRETVQRLLVDIHASDEKAHIPVDAADRNLFVNFKMTESRSHLIWVLKAYDQVDGPMLKRFLNPPGFNTWRQAMLIAEELLPQGKIEPRDLGEAAGMELPSVNFRRSLWELTRLDDSLDDSINPRYLPFDHENTDPARRGDVPKWNQTALLLRHHRQLLVLYDAFAEASGGSGRPPVTFLAEVSRAIGATGTDQDAIKLLERLDPKLGKRRDRLSLYPGERGPHIQLADSLASGLRTRGRMFGDLSSEYQKQVPQASNFRSIAAHILTEPMERPESIAAAIRLLAYYPESAEYLNAWFTEGKANSPELEVAVISTLAQQGEPSLEIWKRLLADYANLSLVKKRALIDNSFRRADGPALLLEQVKAGVIQPAEIDPLKRKTLLDSKDAAIKKLAEELFAALNPANRQQALEEYQPVLKLKADANKGKLVFEKNCSTCHKVGDVGVNVAPDISDTRTKTAAQLLADIIQPNRAIDNNYIGYQVLLKDGTVTTGILSTETSTSLTLKQPGGKVLTVARDEVEQIKASGVSLMPDGLEKNIPPEAMADLLSYLKNWRYLDGKTPLSPPP